MNDKNRSATARITAGLSMKQAAELLGISADDLFRVEHGVSLDEDIVPKLCDIYMVRAEWLTGSVPRRDYASINTMKGSELLTRHDRDVLAEFVAAMPRNDKTVAQRLEEVRNKKR